MSEALLHADPTTARRKHEVKMRRLPKFIVVATDTEKRTSHVAWMDKHAITRMVERIMAALHLQGTVVLRLPWPWWSVPTHLCDETKARCRYVTMKGDYGFSTFGCAPSSGRAACVRWEPRSGPHSSLAGLTSLSSFTMSRHERSLSFLDPMG